MRISIAMTTYNGGKYLQEQLASFLCQTRQPSEIIVCDDGSTDDTLEILEAFRLKAPFYVDVHSNETNLGYTKNFAKALSKCSGDLIFLSDQDDVWFSDKIGVVEKTFIENPSQLLLIHDGELVEQNLNSHGVNKLGQVMAGYNSDTWFVTGALTAIRHNLLTYALPIPEEIIGHDGWLHYVARMMDKRMILDKRLQFIRRHSSNTSEWIASTTKKINRLAVVKKEYMNAPAKSYQDRLYYNTNLANRIRFSDQREGILTFTELPKINNRLQSERKAIMNREALLKHGFLCRKLMAINMLLCGRYSHFNGINSFVRDFLR